jgi:hypothetical protein
MNQSRQREIPLLHTIQRQESKMNHHAGRGYRFEMEVLGAFKAAEIYVTHQDHIQMIAGGKGYCDGWIEEKDPSFENPLKLCEIEVKLRSSVGREPREVLIETLSDRSAKSFLQHALHKDRSNRRRIVVHGFTMTLDDQRSHGVCSYDQYGCIAVVYLQKQWNRFGEYRFRQAIRFYDNFHSFNDDLYQSTDLDDYFDRLYGDQSIQPYLDMINQNRLHELVSHISLRLSDDLEQYTATQQLLLLKILNHQISIGYDVPFKSLSFILKNPNASGFLRPFMDKGWILRNGRNYKVDFEAIVRDLFVSKMKINIQDIFQRIGLDFSETL